MELHSIRLSQPIKFSQVIRIDKRRPCPARKARQVLQGYGTCSESIGGKE